MDHSVRYWEGAVEVLDPQGRPVGRGYVELTGYEKTGGGYVTAVVRGDVAAVRAALDAGQVKAEASDLFRWLRALATQLANQHLGYPDAFPARHLERELLVQSARALGWISKPV